MVIKVLVKIVTVKGSKKYRNANIGKERERFRKYREENIEKCRELSRKYREENLEKVLEDMKQYREQNREKLREHARNYRKQFPLKCKESQRKYREANPEIVKESCRKYSRANPQMSILKTLRRRALKEALPNSLTLIEQETIISHFNGGCALTGSPNFHMDHVIPIALGRGGTVYENIIPLRNDLNMSKNASHIFEWFEINKERFNLNQHAFEELIIYLAEVNGMTTKEYRIYIDWCHDNPCHIIKSK